MQDYISENSSLLANQNQHVKHYTLARDDLNLAVLAKALRDYDSLTQHIDDKFNLKQTQRAQEAEIDRLRIEQIDLKARLAEALEQLTQAETSSEETDSRLNEQKLMIQKLLHAVKTATRCDESAGVPRQFQSMFAEFKFPHSAALENVRFHAPEIVQRQCKHGIFDCRICGDVTGLSGDDLQVLKEVIGGKDEEGEHLQLKNMANRITLLQNERDAILELLGKKMADLQDEFCKARRNATEVLEKKENLLKVQIQKLVEAVQSKSEDDVKCLQLEKQMAHLQGKAAAQAQKSRGKTEVALKQTHDEMKAFEKNKTREIQKSQQESKMRKQKLLNGVKGEVLELQKQLDDVKGVLGVKERRFKALDKRIKDVVVENKLMAEAIKTRTQ